MSGLLEDNNVRKYGGIVYLRELYYLLKKKFICEFMNYEMCGPRTKELRSKIFSTIMLLHRNDRVEKKYLETEVFLKSYYPCSFPNY